MSAINESATPAASTGAVLPALYMVWRDGSAEIVSRPPDLPSRYSIVAVPSDRVDEVRGVVELDGAITDLQWGAYVDCILPDGLFVARHASGEPIGAIGAIHNPRGSRFYFPGGGELGYLVVHPSHRGLGLGRALVDAALGRLRGGGYRTIWLGVQDHRLSAIRTYLGAGFVPFLHPPYPDALGERWSAVFDRLGLPASAEHWPRALTR